MIQMIQMPRNLLTTLLGAIIATATIAQVTPPADDTPDTTPRFVPVEVSIESGARPLAAYQISVRATNGDVSIVGIEGSDAGSVFADPPYYDPRAMQRDHVIIADFSTAAADTLPRGRIRIATIHLRVAGDEVPAFRAELTAAADDRGAPIDATTNLVFGDER